MYTWKLVGHILRRFDANYSHNSGRLTFVKRCSFTNGKFGAYQKEINLWFREQSKQVSRACRRQFEFITAQRIRRYVQIFHLYTRIWDEVALREFIKSWKLRVPRNFLLSSVAITMYDWDHERITDTEINKYLSLALISNSKQTCNIFGITSINILSYRYIHEMEKIQRLRDCTVVCAKCHLRIVIDVIQSNVKYCKCNGVQPITSNQNCMFAFVLTV